MSNTSGWPPAPGARRSAYGHTINIGVDRARELLAERARACAPRVDLEPGRYPYRPACACGWRHAWGYVAEHAALVLADAHRDGRL